MQCFASVSLLLTRHPSLPWPERSIMFFQCWRYGPSPHPGWDRATQA
jgi:hypothetical protein